MAMVVVGPLTLNTGMLLLILMRWGCQLLFDSFPTYLSKLIMAWGFWTVLDPLAVFVVDAFLGLIDPVEVFTLMLEHMQRLCLRYYLSSECCMYNLIRLYNESWLLDFLQRIQGDETSFFVPCDLEISIQELSYLVKKAEQWRGIGGERRKVSRVVEISLFILQGFTRPFPLMELGCKIVALI
ncbi:hypothetical protein NXF25_008365 [Crotalus adamanteus]|uniref:Uncharacterized protein n=1 Tax=Crotalus adamanteus TaxID=8729 RepID=A0AAW1BNK1_CROAD